MTQLQICMGGEAPYVEHVEADYVRIGRSPECEISIPAGVVSGVHAELRRTHGTWHIRDLDSTNGILLNGRVVAQSQLRSGDTIEIGATVGLRVRIHFNDTGPPQNAQPRATVIDAGPTPQLQAPTSADDASPGVGSATVYDAPAVEGALVDDAADGGDASAGIAEGSATCVPNPDRPTLPAPLSSSNHGQSPVLASQGDGHYTPVPGPDDIPPGFALHPSGEVRPLGQPRDPFVVLLLQIVTLGLYGVFFYYNSLNELHRWRGKGISGGAYVLLSVFTLGAFMLLTPIFFPAHVGDAYAEDNKPRPVSGATALWFLVPVLGSLIWFFKTVGSLNAYWRMRGASG